MNPRFLPTHLPGKLDRIVEESSEVIKAICKANRFNLLRAHPDGGPNNAALILSEIADLRHAISVAEDELTERAAIVRGNSTLAWTNELVSDAEMRELIGWDGPMDDFVHFQVCAGEWHREGLEWRFYKDPNWDESDVGC
ncbi:hypothetical protein ACTG4Q_21160 [Bradyrhizobium denitrificans]|jgi:hypothetical protein